MSDDEEEHPLTRKVNAVSNKSTDFNFLFITVSFFYFQALTLIRADCYISWDLARKWLKTIPYLPVRDNVCGFKVKM